MILGLGSDVCSLPRIEAAWARYGERFLRRCFTQAEIALALGRPGQIVPTLARRFAAKEAAAKALGSGIARGIGWKDIEVTRVRGEPPGLSLHGPAKLRLARLTPPGFTTALHLTLSDEPPVAFAVVLIEALPVADGLAGAPSAR